MPRKFPHSTALRASAPNFHETFWWTVVVAVVGKLSFHITDKHPARPPSHDGKTTSSSFRNTWTSTSSVISCLSTSQDGKPSTHLVITTLRRHGLCLLSVGYPGTNAHDEDFDEENYVYSLGVHERVPAQQARKHTWADVKVGV